VGPGSNWRISEGRKAVASSREEVLAATAPGGSGVSLPSLEQPPLPTPGAAHEAPRMLFPPKLLPIDLVLLHCALLATNKGQKIRACSQQGKNS
jgi:hypothetical protein